ncbi:Ahc1p NDAI_0F01030 [Naumovozyma dairenensis CBS 421]|uniref:Protein AHC1 n=1 Tax=Naumovozyma dairenensis (strain ATCC 10597 / BCRC 20456 / CBS 421 / NBRC 0211 / NRRL Y-12639) TaxID=1071378 RepID=G0WCB1_NAUDC|nr:hypothetical protein NDAI_0F01030 [Naumovozyma dairenensis CBS 421]CCD25422.1 hypothetical protein NDAI_0F01030 [Naumovozyma dairenensis CBS 421]
MKGSHQNSSSSSSILTNSNNTNNSKSNSTSNSRNNQQLKKIKTNDSKLPKKYMDSNSNSPNYYQVATPKSPGDLGLSSGENDPDYGHNNPNMANEPLDVTDYNASSSITILPNKDTTTQMQEEKKRSSTFMNNLKFKTMKNEILDKLNLHIMINHKEDDDIRREIKRTDAKLKVIETLHDDKDLLNKIEKFNENQLQGKKFELEQRNQHLSNSSFDFFNDFVPRSSSGLSMSMSTANNNNNNNNNRPPLSTGTNVQSHPYHTRSKSHGKLLDLSLLEATPRSSSTSNTNLKSFGRNYTDNVIDGKGITPKNTAILNMKKKSTAPTTISSCSGMVGKNENNEAIFKRYDGILVIITCAICGRRGFTTAQGMVNHARSKHSKTFSNQPLAVLNNQTLLPNDQQDPSILKKFEELSMDPNIEYLPDSIALPFKINKNISNKSSKRSASSKINSSSKIGKKNKNKNCNNINDNTIDDNNNNNIDNNVNSLKIVETRMVPHLKNIYPDKDNNEPFDDLLQMVNNAHKDLDVILKQPEEKDDEDTEEKKEDEPPYIATPSDQLSKIPSSSNSIEDMTSLENLPNNSNIIQDPPSPPVVPVALQRKILRKRKHEEENKREKLENLLPRSATIDNDNDNDTNNNDTHNINKKLKIAPIVLTADRSSSSEIDENNIPQTSQTSHYNLRRKPKLRSYKA